MRRRSRHEATTRAPYEAPATNISNAVDPNGASREALNQPLRALARLIARQAARETFDRSSQRTVTGRSRRTECCPLLAVIVAVVAFSMVDVRVETWPDVICAGMALN